MDEKNEKKGINSKEKKYAIGEVSCGLPGSRNTFCQNNDPTIDIFNDIYAVFNQNDCHSEVQGDGCCYDHSIVSHTVLDLFRQKRITDFSFISNDRNLWSFVEKSLEKYCTYVERRIEKDLGWDRNNMLCYFFLTHLNTEDLDKLLSTNGKIKYQWWGFTYRIIASMFNVYQVGYSTEPNFRRYYRYLNAVLQKSRHYFTDGKKQIYGYMYEYLEDRGLENFIIEYYGDGAVKWDFKKIHSTLKKIFKFEITGVFWSEGLMKQAEAEQIKAGTLKKVIKDGKKRLIRKVNIEEKASWAEIKTILDKYYIPSDLIGNALNDPIASKTGSTSSNYTLPYLATYAALGYNIPKIAHILQNQHSFKQHLENFESVRKELYHFIEFEFGGVSNLYSLFLTPIFHELYDKDYTVEEVGKLYSEYLSSKIRKPFYKEIFIELTSNGWDPTEILSYEPSFWHFLGGSENYYNGGKGFADKLTKFVNRKFIPEEYKNLKEIFKKNKVTSTDLKHYLMAPQVLKFLKERIPWRDVGRHFITPHREDGYSEHLIYDILQNVYHSTWTQLKHSINKEILKQMVISTPEKIQTLEYLANRLFITPDSLRKNKKYLISYFAFKPNHKPSQINKRQWSYLLSAQIAIVGPILYKYYSKCENPQIIAESLGFFENVYDVERWTQFLFSTTSDKVLEKYNKKPLDSSWWYNTWGVRID